MKKICMLCMLVGLGLLTGACSPDNTSAAETPAPNPDPNPEPDPDPDPTPEKPGNGRYLAVYFSRSGNTRSVANEIGNRTEGTVIEVVPATAYPPDYNATLSRAQQEISAIDNSGTYPSINTAVDSFDDYDVVFICAPLWHSRMATPVQSFLNSHREKLAGKQLALAVTSSSSGISSVVADARRLCPQSVWVGEPLWVRASQAENPQSQVAEWLETLNLEPGSVGVFNLSKGVNGKAPTVRLSSGYEMPVVGLGTYSLHGVVCINSVKSAIASGFRKFDTASIYGNEEEVGQGIRESGVPREEVFVATKLYPNQFANPEQAIEECLRKLNIGYVDLMLLHHPGTNDVAAYQAMERAVAQGRIRSIGLSNYYVEEMTDFLPRVTIRPALVQNEIHPYYQENKVIPYMHRQGIVVEAWYPFGGRGHTAAMLGNETISRIAEAHGRSSAQVILRWDLQKGVVVIPGSSNPDHIKENISVFDFELTAEEMNRINALDRNEKHDWY